MTLATRCPACGTVFRVVQDQLRVSEGWVRCGRCSEAFNALEAMIEWPPARPAVTPPAEPAPTPEPDIRPDPASPAATATAPSAVPMPAAVSAANVQDPPAQAVAAEATLIELPPGVEVVATDGALSADLATPTGEPAGPAVGVDMAPGIEGPEAEPLAPVVASASAVEPAAAISPPHDAGRERPAPGASPAPADQPAPSFVLQAERAARWRRPGVRLALGLMVLVAASGLAAQVTYAFRDRIAAASPAVRPLLLQACAVIGCRVGEYRQIDALSVESSGLVRVDGAPVYRLAVTLRNRSALEVAAPALDLALTDAQGRQIARRVLQMSDLNLPLRSLKPGSELPIQVPLGIGGAVSGYTVEIFYP